MIGDNRPVAPAINPDQQRRMIEAEIAHLREQVAAAEHEISEMATRRAELTDEIVTARGQIVALQRGLGRLPRWGAWRGGVV
jgi:predicted  nucleic acid-binding Zn-ribbon protein